MVAASVLLGAGSADVGGALMSLLHEALKKAGKEGAGGGTGRLIIDHEEPRGGTGLRTYVLAAVAVASLLLLVTFRFYKKGEGSAPSGPSPVAQQATPLGIGGGPAAPELLEQASRLLGEKKWAEAREMLEKAVILEPRNVEAYNNLGLALRKLGEKDKALEQYQKALSVQPDCAECLNNLGVLYLSDRQLGEAKAQFQKALQMRPEYADPHFHLALVAEAEGRVDEAKGHYRKFTELAHGIDAEFLLKIQKRMASL